MAEVHEITSTALAELINSHGLDVCPSIARELVSTKELVGKFLLVECFAFFDNCTDTPYLHGIREEMTDAVWRTVDRHNNNDGMYHCAREMEVWHVVDDEPEIERPDYYRVDMGGNGSAHFPEYEQACEFVDYMMHQPLDKVWCTFCEVWACWSDGSENWLGDHWRSVFDGRVFHMRDCDALADLGLI